MSSELPASKQENQEKLILLPEYDSNNPNFHEKIICDFILKETLGKGTFGVVKLAINTQTGEKVAIKILSESKLPKEEKINFYREIEILKNLKHPNIIRLYSSINKEKQLYLITEYIKGIELFQYISLKKKIEESEACLYFQQIICGLEYLHKMGIVHRDIKPENILIDHYLKEIKIIDFGLSNKYTNNSDLLSTLCGSPLYAAPEVLMGNGYKPTPVDIWSAGIVLYFMLSGKLPFQGDSNEELYQKIIDAKIKNIEGVSKEANNLIKKLLNPNPRKRLTIEKIKIHPWFNLFNNNNFDIYSNYGILTNKYVIPIDVEILEEIKNKFSISTYEILNSILGNKINDISTLYYLIVSKKNKEGKSNISDFKSEIFMNYLRDEKNLLKKYGNNINKVIKMRRKKIEGEKNIKLENYKNKRGLSLEKFNSDEKKKFFRSLSPPIKNYKNDILYNSNNNTFQQSPNSIRPFDSSEFFNSTSNYKIKVINTEAGNIKNKGEQNFKKLLKANIGKKINFIKKNPKQYSNFSQRTKIGKHISNNDYNKSKLDHLNSKNEIKNSYITNLTYNNLSSERQSFKEWNYNKLFQNQKIIENRLGNSKKKKDSQNKDNKYEKINFGLNDIKIKKINSERKTKDNSLKIEIISSLHPIKEKKDKFQREKQVKISDFKIGIYNDEVKSKIIKEKGHLSSNSSSKKLSEKNEDKRILIQKKNTEPLYKKEKKLKNNIMNKANNSNSNNNIYCIISNDKNYANNKNIFDIENYLKTVKNINEGLFNKKEMNRYFSQDLFDLSNKRINNSKPKKGKIYKNKKLNFSNDKRYGEILPSNSNLYLNNVKSFLNDNNKNIISISNFKNNNNYLNDNGFVEPFDLNSIFLKKKGIIKKEFLEKLEKKNIKYKKISNYGFVIEMKNNISFESVIKMSKNSENKICILKIKKIKGNNSLIFDCLKKIN